MHTIALLEVVVPAFPDGKDFNSNSTGNEYRIRENSNAKEEIIIGV